jgi:hypothetical protein
MRSKEHGTTLVYTDKGKSPCGEMWMVIDVNGGEMDVEMKRLEGLTSPAEPVELKRPKAPGEQMTNANDNDMCARNMLYGKCTLIDATEPRPPILWDDHSESEIGESESAESEMGEGDTDTDDSTDRRTMKRRRHSPPQVQPRSLSPLRGSPVLRPHPRMAYLLAA